MAGGDHASFRLDPAIEKWASYQANELLYRRPTLKAFLFKAVFAVAAPFTLWCVITASKIRHDKSLGKKHEPQFLEFWLVNHRLLRPIFFSDC